MPTWNYRYADGLEKHIAEGGDVSERNVSDMIAMVKWLSTKIKEIYEDDNE